MDEFRWAIKAAEAWVAAHGGVVTGLTRQMDGRWFARVITGEPNWDHARNLFVVREADLGMPPEEE